MREYEIGEIYKYKNTEYKVCRPLKRGEVCTGCHFREKKEIKCPDDFICEDYKRNDGEDVILIKI